MTTQTGRSDDINHDDVPGNGRIAVTWSPQATQHIRPVMQLRYDLARAAWLGRVPEPA